MNIHTVIQTKLFISKGTLSCFVLFFLLELVVFWKKKSVTIIIILNTAKCVF